MPPNVQDSGREGSLSMGLLDPSFVAAVPSQAAKPIHLETEHAFGRLEPYHHSSMDLPWSGPGSSPEAPDGPVLAPNRPVLGASLYQVHLPDWYSRYTACLQHFLDQSQHSVPVQSLAAYINIRLPCQQLSNPVSRFATSSASSLGNGQASQVSLRHYIRRLVATGNDTPPVLEAFFGGDWADGIGNICKQERMNYLFAAKSSGWASTKAAYDVLPDEHTPFLRPLQGATEEELSTAEKHWSEWLAMEDWMVGPRSPWE
ncbi:hypothetical protein BDW62DRAFT_200498 [Aspergillus aurantiobrunneus]